MFARIESELAVLPMQIGAAKAKLSSLNRTTTESATRATPFPAARFSAPRASLTLRKQSSMNFKPNSRASSAKRKRTPTAARRFAGNLS